MWRIIITVLVLALFTLGFCITGELRHQPRNPVVATNMLAQSNQVHGKPVTQEAPVGEPARVKPSKPKTSPLQEIALTVTEKPNVPGRILEGKGTLPAKADEKWTLGPEEFPRLIRVDRSKQRVYLFEDGELKYEFVCSTSSTGRVSYSESPEDDPHDHIGIFHVLEKYDMWRSKKGIEMPFFVKYYVGHGFHSTKETDKLGTPASSGCVRLDCADARTLNRWVHVGDPVEII